MKQYCRYCIWCIDGDAIWCEKLIKIMSEAAAKRVNKCKDFEFNETDAFNPDHTYKERKEKEYKQLTLFDLEVEEDG